MNNGLFVSKYILYIHQSALIFKLLTGEVNNINYFFTVALVKGWNSLGSKLTSQFLKFLKGAQKNWQV